MKPLTSARLAISGLADYSPGPPVDNDELEDVLQAPVKSLMRYFGIETRHYAIDPRTGAPREPGMGTTEMLVRAARLAIERAGLDSGDIDTLICATSTPDTRLPPLTHAVQGRLGLGDVGLYDLRGGCAVSMQGLTLASALIQCGRAQRVVLTLADTISPHYLVPLLGTRDAGAEALINAATFADGAAALVLQAAEEGGAGFELLSVNARSRFPRQANGFGVDAAGATTHNHRAIKENLPIVMGAAVDELLTAAAGSGLQIQRLIVPQVNRSMVDLVRTELHDKLFYIGHRIGNCPAPAVMRALARGMDSGEITRGGGAVGVIAVETASWSFGVSLLH
jgi:3-oxoacyl-[acyl-carrier-protein] synthase III